MQLSSPICFCPAVSLVTPVFPLHLWWILAAQGWPVLFALRAPLTLLKAHSWQICCRQMHMPGCPRFVRLFRGRECKFHTTHNCNSCINRKYPKPLLFKMRGEPALWKSSPCPKVWFLKMCVTIKMLFLVFESLCVCAQGHARCLRASRSPQTQRKRVTCLIIGPWLWTIHSTNTHSVCLRTLLCGNTVRSKSHVLITSEKITVVL